MAIDDLTAVVPPPTASGFDQRAWQATEEWLGFSLPSDFKDFAQTYGTGTFCDGFLQVYCPSSSFELYREFVEYQAGVLQAHIDAGVRNIPFAPYPSCPGLLAWGADENGHRLHWLTAGAANEWPVIAESHEGDFERFDVPVTSFLAQALRNGIRPSHIWHQPFEESELNFA
ncbi:MAG: SMI1/KNR4 family protein [Planctomycetaceae bacterium]|nr:SMI1/KNR4 family protein [Planctomycetaceae bacterium]